MLKLFLTGSTTSVAKSSIAYSKIPLPVSSVPYKQELSKIGMLTSYPSNHWGLSYKGTLLWAISMFELLQQKQLVRFCDTKVNPPLIAEIRINWNFYLSSKLWWFAWTWARLSTEGGMHPPRFRIQTVEAVSCSFWREEGLSWPDVWLSTQKKPKCWHHDTKLQSLHLQNKLLSLPVTAGHCS